jgi:hypothetical protein
MSEAKRKELDAAACSLPPFVQTAFVFAARYTHHRNTGGTLAVCRALALVWPQLSEGTQEQILKESHEATTNLREWREFRGDEEENAEGDSQSPDQ